MSIRLNSNKGSAKIVPVIVIGIIFIILLMNILGRSPRHVHNSSSRSANSGTKVSWPPVNPLVNMLNDSSGPANAPREGIAIGVAIDVSGSMNDRVKDTDGFAREKIEIARRCALDIFKQADSFMREHQDSMIEVGLFEFSTRQNRPSCRQVIPFGPIQTDSVVEAVKRLYPDGGTPIGDAMVAVKQKMNATGLSRQHLLIITDGENTRGYDPGDVADALSRMPEEKRTSMYFFAFDVSAEKFKHVRDSGGLVIAASNGQELEQTLIYVLTGKILVEQPEIPGTN